MLSTQIILNQLILSHSWHQILWLRILVTQYFYSLQASLSSFPDSDPESSDPESFIASNLNVNVNFITLSKSFASVVGFLFNLESDRSTCKMRGKKLFWPTESGRPNIIYRISANSFLPWILSSRAQLDWTYEFPDNQICQTGSARPDWIRTYIFYILPNKYGLSFLIW